MEERIFNTSETLKILRKHYITDDLQMVSRYIRQERLLAEKESNKDGWRIRESDLYDFIDREKPGIVEIIYVYENYLNELMVNTNPESFLKMRGKDLLHFFHDKEKKSFFTGKEKFNNDRDQQIPTYDLIPEEEKSVEGKVEKKESPFQLDMDKFIEAFLGDPACIEKLVNALAERNIVNKTEGSTKKVKRSKMAKINKHNRTYDEFLTWIKETKALGFVLIEDCSNTILERIYETYYQDGILKPNLLDEQKKEYVCPVTKRSKNQLTYLLKETIPLLKAKFAKEININFEEDTHKTQESAIQTYEVTEQITLDEVLDVEYELDEEEI